MRIIVYTAVLALGVGHLAGAKETKTPETKNEIAADNQNQSRAALRRELAGDNAARQAELQKIADQSEDNLAHWSLGMVKVGNDWVRYDQAVHQGDRWPELYKYQQERTKSSSSFDDQLFLADGCRAHQLRDEERAHLMGALRENWKFTEAHQRLGHVPADGVWVTAEQLRQVQHQQQRDQARFTVWQPRVERLRNEFRAAASPGQSKLVLSKLAKIQTPDAIPAMERLFAIESPQAAAVYLDWVSRIDSYESSLALARASVFAEQPELRSQAQLLLRDHPPADYVPWLLSGLDTVKEVDSRWQFDLNGFASLRLTRQLIANTEEHQSQVEVRQNLVPGFDLPTKIIDNGNGTYRVFQGATVTVAPGQMTPVPTQGINLISVIEYLEIMRERHSWFEVSQDMRTGRILRTLSSATGIDDLKTADDWWSWWRDQNDFVLAKGQKTKSKDNYEETWFVNRRRAIPVTRVDVAVNYVYRKGSCFAAGTQVETEQGLKAIEQIQAGDRVLAQDIETGELSFKPVFDTTVRENAKLLRVETDGEILTCSQGHPFWATGAGWCMAKDLQPGTKLHHLEGSTSVKSVTEAGVGTVYNLVVDEAHTYFVGSSRLLTHDVTQRIPDDQVLPGLRKEFSDSL
ncbi:polymorphic toxin-type HINT domain-containing protein [Planctomicrobium piriforme]|uniref:Pretoxin HINT domain-containing protein n=1 Tax=Planctomicrobium piriforme TaxID=1576369 RepID=A0A1I3JBA8_9PLAN|nr:polymorphic toxin-type HINT domain-containing protein [Planctomicrobium piriforme]SFI57420.1 Pretoxin HINT domain-containing protein [Planctomicrobium piriforme]